MDAVGAGDRLGRAGRDAHQNLFGPDGALYLVDYGAVRDFGVSNPENKFRNPADGPLLQIPHTGVIWKITKVAAPEDEREDQDD